MPTDQSSSFLASNSLSKYIQTIVPTSFPIIHRKIYTPFHFILWKIQFIKCIIKYNLSVLFLNDSFDTCYHLIMKVVPPLCFQQSLLFFFFFFSISCPSSEKYLVSGVNHSLNYVCYSRASQLTPALN